MAQSIREYLRETQNGYFDHLEAIATKLDDIQKIINEMPENDRGDKKHLEITMAVLICKIETFAEHLKDSGLRTIERCG